MVVPIRKFLNATSCISSFPMFWAANTAARFPRSWACCFVIAIVAINWFHRACSSPVVTGMTVVGVVDIVRHVDVDRCERLLYATVIEFVMGLAIVGVRYMRVKSVTEVGKSDGFHLFLFSSFYPHVAVMKLQVFFIIWRFWQMVAYSVRYDIAVFWWSSYVSNVRRVIRLLKPVSFVPWIAWDMCFFSYWVISSWI